MALFLMTLSDPSYPKPPIFDILYRLLPFLLLNVSICPLDSGELMLVVIL